MNHIEDVANMLGVALHQPFRVNVTEVGKIHGCIPVSIIYRFDNELVYYDYVFDDKWHKEDNGYMLYWLILGWYEAEGMK